MAIAFSALGVEPIQCSHAPPAGIYDVGCVETDTQMKPKKLCQQCIELETQQLRQRGAKVLYEDDFGIVFLERRRVNNPHIPLTSVRIVHAFFFSPEVEAYEAWGEIAYR